MDRIQFFTLLMFTTVISAPPCIAQDAPSSQLSKDDRTLLIGLTGDPLTDPTGKQFCTVAIVARTCWGSSGEVDIEAWFQPASDVVSARVYFTDNDWIAAPKEPAGARTTTTWNFENQPTLFRMPDGSRVTMTYNANNRRVDKE